jgi:lysophospholipase L1-like esterase
MSQSTRPIDALRNLTWAVAFSAFVCTTSVSAQSVAQKPFDTITQFKAFLEESLNKPQPIHEQDVEAFNDHAFSFWENQKLPYWENPEHYKTVLSLYYRAKALYRSSATVDIDRYKSDIERFQQFDARNTPPPNPVVFVGSSSIVFWETAIAFPDYSVLNRGFGGATLAEVYHYYDLVIRKFNPSVVVVYCDIDIEMGHSPKEALRHFKELTDRVAADFPNTHVLFLSMKPTLMDDFLGPDVGKNKTIANRAFKAFAESTKNTQFVNIVPTMMRSDGRVRPEIFRDDGMHLNALGYDLWNAIIQRHLAMLPTRQ